MPSVTWNNWLLSQKCFHEHYTLTTVGEAFRSLWKVHDFFSYLPVRTPKIWKCRVSQEISGHDRGSRSLLTLQDILNWKMQVIEQYCRFGNFRENLIFAKSIKIHISVVKNSRLRQDLPISVNDRVILPFREGFIFTKLRICYMRSFAKINSSWKFSNLQYSFYFGRT